MMIGESAFNPVPADTAPDLAPVPVPVSQPVAKDVGGRNGPDPTRYGDWEKNGRCIDF